MSATQATEIWGKVVSVHGAVVEVAFPAGSLPLVETLLAVAWDQPQTLLLEVQGHVDAHTVRAVALQATAGLARGVRVRATGAPLSVPVGKG
ncbi:MAG: F0F1 ATP synthase subunit beta, partial [Acidovorax sp.]